MASKMSDFEVHYTDTQGDKGKGIVKARTLKSAMNKVKSAPKFRTGHLYKLNGLIKVR